MQVVTGLQISDCNFRNQASAIYSFNYEGDISWAVERINVENVTYASFKYIYPGSGYFRDCRLAKGENFVVAASSYQEALPLRSNIDMTNNWWGTSDPDSIQAWILDRSDNELIGTVIEWDPFNDESVAVEKKSLGGLRSMFR